MDNRFICHSLQCKFAYFEQDVLYAQGGSLCKYAIIRIRRRSSCKVQIGRGIGSTIIGQNGVFTGDLSQLSRALSLAICKTFSFLLILTKLSFTLCRWPWSTCYKGRQPPRWAVTPGRPTSRRVSPTSPKPSPRQPAPLCALTSSIYCYSGDFPERDTFSGARQGCQGGAVQRLGACLGWCPQRSSKRGELGHW